MPDLSERFDLTEDQIDNLYLLFAGQATERAIQRERVAAQITRKILVEIRNLEADIVAMTVSANPTEPRRQRFRLARLENLLNQVKTRINEAYSDIGRITNADLRQFVDIEADFYINRLNRSFNEATNIEREPFRLPIEELLFGVIGRQAILGATPTEWWRTARDNAFERVKRAYRVSGARGDDLDDLLKVVTGTRANRFRDRVLQTSSRGAQTAARTFINALSNTILEAIISENEGNIAGTQHMSVLDSQTSDICIARSGVRWTVDREPIGHKFPFQVPPLHPNCRSLIVPVFDDRNPPALTFDDWFSTLGASRQNEIIGVGKGKLYRRGEITLRELVNQFNRPLTLDQLKELR